VSVTGPASALANSSPAYTLLVTNGAGGPARAVVTFGSTNSAGAQAYLSGFTGNVCGNWSLAPSGAATQTAAATASTTGVTCTPRVGMKQIELYLPASRSFSGVLTVAAGATPGNVAVSSSIVVSEAQDTNAANNASTVNTAISYPNADLSVTLSTTPTTVSYSWTQGELTATVRNLSSGAMAAPGANGGALLTWAPAAGSASVTFGTVTCASVTTGATCATDGRVYIPAGGTVVYKVAYSTGPDIGELDVTASITLTSAGVTDPNLANNTSKLRLKVAEVMVSKTCMFTTPQKGKFLGQTNPDSSKNGWASIGPFNPWGSSTSLSWMFWQLFDGWTTQSGQYTTGPVWTGMYLDPRTATWKGTNKLVGATRMSNGSYEITLDRIRPQVEYLYNGRWTKHWSNTGSWNAATLAYSDYSCGNGPGGYYQDCPYQLLNQVTGAVKPIGGSVVGVWRPQSDSKAWVNYRSSGTDVYGVQYRQVWIENSPGPNCMAAGTTLATY